MSADSYADRERILERLLTGELDPDGDEGRRLLERDPALRVELEALRAVEGAIEEAALEREAVEGLPTEEHDEARAVAALEAIWASEQRSPAPRRWGHFAWVGLAAGVLLAAVLGYAFFGGGGVDPVDPIELGGGPIECIEPKGEVERFELFLWTEELPSGYRFELYIRDAITREILHREPRLTGYSWTAPAEVVEKLPATILWSVKAEMPGGDVAIDAPEVEARRID